MFQKKKKYEGRNEGAHMWTAVQSRRKTRLHHRGLLLFPVSWSSVGTYFGTYWSFFRKKLTPIFCCWKMHLQ